jgi:hypothetical protein
MADIRIKDLTTTASTTAADDFFAADGATNGTRKLSAYSPTFGGNATVGGTLTVNGGTSTINASAGTDAKLFIKQNATNASYLIIETTNVVDKAYAGIQYVDDGSIRWSIGGVGQYVNAAYDFNVDVAGANALSINRTTRNVLIGGTTDISGSNGLKVFGTTASTSTSSGALVVSGGVGVAGAIVSGGNIGIGNVNPVVAYTSTGSLLGSGDNPQVRLSSTGSSGWAFSTYANTAADGKWSAGLNAGANRYIITNDLDLSGTAALSILPTTLDATFGGALLATGTLTANAASNAFRITNSQTPASAAATGTAGTIAWDSSYIYVCTATNTWKRVAISTW